MSDSAAQRYAQEIKAWRKKLDVTQAEFGKLIEHSEGLVAGVEQCVRIPSVTFARKCDEVTGAPGTFVRWQPQVTAESYPSYFREVAEVESAAVRIHGWELGAIPGLLQTPAYIRSVISAGHPYASADEIEQMVAARVDRQQILSRPAPPLLWYVVHEGVLRHVIGSPDIMRAQLDHLLDLCDRLGVIIQVLGYSAHDHPGVDGPIAVFDFDQRPSVGYTEGWGGGDTVRDQGEVGKLMTVIGLLRAAAMNRRDSAAFIREIRSTL